MTGGAGFIGSNFVRGLLSGAWNLSANQVRVLDSFTYAGRRENLDSVINDSRLSITNGSILDAALVRELLAEVSVVVHFAAESHVDRSIKSARKFIETNICGTHTLLEAARDIEGLRFLHVSTDEVYGSVPFGSSKETDLLLPNSPYSASKASSDLIVRSYVQTYGVDAVITRCSNNFGPFQYPEKLIPKFITNLLRNLPIPVYGTGTNVRDWLHVDDHCNGIALAISKGLCGEIYNIGGGTEIDNLALTQMILDAMGFNHDMIEYVADRAAHDLRYSVDWEKARIKLGYQPQKSLTNELPSIIDWYKANEWWWRPLVRS